MIGRGTRLNLATDKLMFRIYDYTNATRLFGEKFRTEWQPRERGGGGEPSPPDPTIQVEGFDVRVSDAGRYILTHVDGKAMPVTVEKYKERLGARLVGEAPTLETFRSRSIEPPRRREMLGRLPDAGRSAILLQRLEDMNDYDLYDVLAELGYGLAPRTFWSKWNQPTGCAIRSLSNSKRSMDSRPRRCAAPSMESYRGFPGFIHPVTD
jgi:type I restriction enzyme R subunit